MRQETHLRSYSQLLRVLTLCAVTLCTVMAFAQQQQTQAPADTSDAKLQSVAKAYVKVQAIQQEYGPKVKAAKDAQEAQQLREEANTKSAKAVDEVGGVTVEEYTQTLQAAQSDDQLRQRLVQQIQKEQPKEQPK